MKNLIWMILLCTSAIALGEFRGIASTEPTQRATLFLFDVRTRRILPVSDAIRPNRVYVRRASVDAPAFYLLSTPQAELATPEEQLLDGTVVSGEKLGDNARNRYVLKPDGTWTRTNAMENVLFYRAGRANGKPEVRLLYPSGG